MPNLLNLSHHKVIQLNFKFFTIEAKLRLIYAIVFNKIATIPIDGGAK